MKTKALNLPLLAGTVVLLQLIVTGMGKTFYLTQITMAVYYAIVVLGLCLLMGYAGQASLGHGAFFAIGGYVSALLTTHNFALGHSAAWTRPLQDLGVFVARKSLYDDNELLTMTPWAAFGAAMLVTLVVAALIGYPSLRPDDV